MRKEDLWRDVVLAYIGRATASSGILEVRRGELADDAIRCANAVVQAAEDLRLLRKGSVSIPRPDEFHADKQVI